MPLMPYHPVEIEDIKQITPQAILVNAKGVDYWIPKSCIENNEEEFHDANNDRHVSLTSLGAQTIFCAEWFLKDKGISY